jgi:hypothetical protein
MYVSFFYSTILFTRGVCVSHALPARYIYKPTITTVTITSNSSIRTVATQAQSRVEMHLHYNRNKEIG